MASHNVEYQISLKDLLSGKVKEAEHHVNHFEHTLEHTRDLTKEMVGAAVGFFGLYEGIEFIKGSVEAYNNVEKSLSQLRAGLESTKGAAGVTYEELTEGAEKFAASTIYNKETILDMQAQLLSFPEVTKEVFDDAEQAVMDLATRTGHSLHDVSIMVGKALGDPTKGITSLRRVGVEFSASQTEVIKKLAETGHVAEAQKMILKELSREYAGSTAAASATAGGQMEILKHQFDEVRESVGKLVMEELVALAPAIKGMIEDFKHGVEWIGKHREGLIKVAKAVAEVSIAIWALNKVKVVYETITGIVKFFSVAEVAAAEATATQTVAVQAQTVAVTELTTATEALSIARGQAIASAAIGTTEGLAISGMGAGAVMPMAASTAGGVMIGSEQAAAGTFGAGLMSGAKSAILPVAIMYMAGEVLQAFLGKGVQDAIGYDEKGKPLDVWDFAGKNHALQRRAFADRNMSESAISDMTHFFVKAFGAEKMAEKTLSVYDRMMGKKEGGGNAVKQSTLLNEAQSSVQGQTIKNYNVTIGNLIHDFTIKTTNLREAATDIKRIVTESLTASINDSEIGN